ncbi:MAG: HAD family hydrolase [Victivallales bacterium]|nr:HAD family hydrolase [Victivallales bacterium]
MNEKPKACFLDRDGVIIEEKNYLGDPDGVEILPGVPEALKMLKDEKFLLIVISNQSGVARGYFDLAAVDAVNARINKLLRGEGVELDAFYTCPHHPEHDGVCPCRKPAPGMIEQAVKDFNIDLKHSFLVGDKRSDVEAAVNAGIPGIMVMTGHGKAQTVSADTSLAPDLLHAVKLFLKGE